MIVGGGIAADVNHAAEPKADTASSGQREPIML
jgi:hypothetical protein